MSRTNWSRTSRRRRGNDAQEEEGARQEGQGGQAGQARRPDADRLGRDERRLQAGRHLRYSQKEAAETRAAELTAKGKGTHFVQKAKEPMPDNAPGLGAAIPRPAVTASPVAVKETPAIEEEEELEEEEEAEPEVDGGGCRGRGDKNARGSGTRRFETRTSPLSGVRSSQLSYSPFTCPTVPILMAAGPVRPPTALPETPAGVVVSDLGDVHVEKPWLPRNNERLSSVHPPTHFHGALGACAGAPGEPGPFDVEAVIENSSDSLRGCGGGSRRRNCSCRTSGSPLKEAIREAEPSIEKSLTMFKSRLLRG